MLPPSLVLWRNFNVLTQIVKHLGIFIIFENNCGTIGAPAALCQFAAGRLFRLQTNLLQRVMVPNCLLRLFRAET